MGSRPGGSPDQQAGGADQSATERIKAAATETLQRTSETLKDSTTQAAERLQEQGATWASAQKERLGEGLSHVSQAFRQATDSLRRDNDHNVAACTQFVAEGTDRMSDYLRSGDMGRFRGDVERFARRRPEVFFGGMFLAGLAISRFLKARPVFSEQAGGDVADDMGLVRRHEQFDHQDWSAT